MGSECHNVWGAGALNYGDISPIAEKRQSRLEDRADCRAVASHKRGHVEGQGEFFFRHSLEGFMPGSSLIVRGYSTSVGGPPDDIAT